MNDIRDIKPPLALPEAQTWLFVLAGLVLLAVAGVIVRQWRRSAPSRRSKRLLWRALRRLEAHSSRLDDRIFAYHLAELLRRALARCTGIAANALTTEEILLRLPACGLPPNMTIAVAEALHRADPPRYAPQPPQDSSPFRKTDLDTVRDLLRRQERSCRP